MRVQARVGEQVREFQAEALLIAVGREPVTRGFGLENRERVTWATVVGSVLVLAGVTVMLLT